MDGGPTGWRSQLLIEHASPGAPSYCADRTPQDIFVRYATGEEEYYRLGAQADLYQRTNRITDPRFQTRITSLRNKTRVLCNPLPPEMPPF
jgi:hypothetical protein